MKIITVNLPENYILALDSLVGEDRLYPSRSEVIRVALRDFMKEELTNIPLPPPIIPISNEPKKTVYLKKSDGSSVPLEIKGEKDEK